MYTVHFVCFLYFFAQFDRNFGKNQIRSFYTKYDGEELWTQTLYDSWKSKTPMSINNVPEKKLFTRRLMICRKTWNLNFKRCDDLKLTQKLRSLHRAHNIYCVETNTNEVCESRNCAQIEALKTRSKNTKRINAEADIILFIFTVDPQLDDFRRINK